MANETWVVICPHEYLSEKANLDELESKVFEMISREPKVMLSTLWKAFPCHLWELDAVLQSLKEKGLVLEEQL
ncbi:MAG: hypothetical protein QXF26_06335 [Candidatus Bathyarchaeia archaeon]